MILGNKALRDHAQPFISEFIETSDLDYGGSALQSPSFSTSVSRTIASPMTQPEKGDIVEAYLFMEMVAPSDQGLSVRVGIGTFAGGLDEIVPDTEYTEDFIATEHRRICGTDTPFSVAANGTLTIDVDLTRSIPKRGDADFVSDGFVLIVTFASLPAYANGYRLSKFKLSCTAQMGLGT